MSIPIPETVDLAKYIELRGDRPHIRGRRVPVATIAHSAQSQGWSISELAYQFALSEPQVLAALLYYAEHAELDVSLMDFHESPSPETSLEAFSNEIEGIASRIDVQTYLLAKSSLPEDSRQRLLANIGLLTKAIRTSVNSFRSYLRAKS
jgi:uncharacterized protein (DUF433 family)